MKRLLRRLNKNNLEIIEVRNRINRKTRDVVVKVEVKGMVGEIQLCLEYDRNLNEFNHEIYEIKRSSFGVFFGSVVWFGKF